MRIWVKKKNPQWQDVQTNLDVILNPKSFSEIENKSAERGPLQPKKARPTPVRIMLRLIIF
jgi:hypothetical protein